MLRGSDYSEIQWLSLDSAAPTQNEIDACLEANEYKKLRAAEYPPLADYVDALYHQSTGNDALMQTYWSNVAAVKAKYPKP